MTNICNRNDNCWGIRFSELVGDWPETDIKKLVSYFPFIEKAIERAHRDSKVSKLENSQPKMACLECEERYYFAPIIRNNGLSRNSIYRRVYNFSLYRMWTWFPSLVRQIEAGYIHKGNSVEEYDGENQLVDFGVTYPEGHLLFNLADCSQANQEEILLTEERLKLVQKAILEIERSGIPNASIYVRILKLQLSGIDVGKEHASILGVSEREVIPLKFQAFKRMGKIMAQYDPGLLKKQKAYRDEKVIRRVIERSTLEERLAQSSPAEEVREKEPQTIFIWTRKDGWVEHVGYSKEDLANIPPPPWSKVA